MGDVVSEEHLANTGFNRNNFVWLFAVEFSSQGQAPYLLNGNSQCTNLNGCFIGALAYSDSKELMEHHTCPSHICYCCTIGYTIRWRQVGRRGLFNNETIDFRIVSSIVSHVWTAQKLVSYKNYCSRFNFYTLIVIYASFVFGQIMKARGYWKPAIRT